MPQATKGSEEKLRHQGPKIRLFLNRQWHHGERERERERYTYTSYPTCIHFHSLAGISLEVMRFPSPTQHYLFFLLKTYLVMFQYLVFYWSFVLVTNKGKKSLLKIPTCTILKSFFFLKRYNIFKAFEYFRKKGGLEDDKFVNNLNHLRLTCTLIHTSLKKNFPPTIDPSSIRSDVKKKKDLLVKLPLACSIT